MADRFGRRLPLMLNVIFYAVISVLSGLAPSYQVFLLLRMLFGIGMGGEWGVGASLALEVGVAEMAGCSPGCCRKATRWATCWRPSRSGSCPVPSAATRTDGGASCSFIGGLPALLSLFIRAKVKESEAWHEHRTDWTTYRRSMLQHWPRFLYLVLLMTMMNFISHGTQDMYPTFLLRQRMFTPAQTADITMLSMVGAILGGLCFGYYSDRRGRRRAMITAALCALVVVPLWIAAPKHGAHRPRRFLMQFFVQGAWGVIPAHINELSPGHLRGFFPGLCLSDRRAGRGEHHLHRGAARRALHLRAVDGRAGRDGHDRRRRRHIRRPGGARRARSEKGPPRVSPEWTCASSKFSRRSPKPARSRRAAASCTCRSRPSAVRFCCSKRSWASRCSCASGARCA